MNNVPDFSAKYNTQLTPAEEKEFLRWANKHNRLNDSFDYDMRGAWKNGASQADNGHFPDTYKKPNHPTFSNESIYNKVDGFVGGAWSKRGNKDVYTPSASNLKFHSARGLKDYFAQVEPDTLLDMSLGQQIYQGNSQ